MNKSTFFDHYFNNAVVNSIMIMDHNGNFLEVNQSFTTNFGYTIADLKGKNFREIFTFQDKAENIPEIELETVLKNRQSDDEGFILHKDGHAVWCTGEAMLVEGPSGEKFIVKDIINLESRKHINLFLNSTEELLDRIFYGTKDLPMIIIDSAMKIQKMNTAFINFFEIKHNPGMNTSLTKLDNSFWQQPDIRSEISRLIVKNIPLSGKSFIYKTASGNKKNIILSSKIVFQQPENTRRIFILVDEVTD